MAVGEGWEEAARERARRQLGVCPFDYGPLRVGQVTVGADLRGDGGFPRVVDADEEVIGTGRLVRGRVSERRHAGTGGLRPDLRCAAWRSRVAAVTVREDGQR